MLELLKRIKRLNDTINLLTLRINRKVLRDKMCEDFDRETERLVTDTPDKLMSNMLKDRPFHLIVRK